MIHSVETEFNFRPIAVIKRLYLINQNSKFEGIYFDRKKRTEIINRFKNESEH